MDGNHDSGVPTPGAVKHDVAPSIYKSYYGARCMPHKLEDPWRSLGRERYVELTTASNVTAVKGQTFVPVCGWLVVQLSPPVFAGMNRLNQLTRLAV